MSLPLPPDDLLYNPFNIKEIFLYFEEKPLTQQQRIQVNKLLPFELLSLLLDYGVIAGGAALSVFHRHYNGCRPDDIDVFILNSDRSKLLALLQSLQAYCLSNNIRPTYSSYGSVIQVMSTWKIQIILDFCPTVEDLLTSFDMDYIQCAIKKNGTELVGVRSNVAIIASENCLVTYIAPTRRNRLRKAEAKGFQIPLYYKALLGAEPCEKQVVNMPEHPFDEIVASVDKMKAIIKRTTYDAIHSSVEDDVSDFPVSCQFIYRPTPTEETVQKLDMLSRSEDSTDQKIASLLRQGLFRMAMAEAFIYNEHGNSLVPSLINKVNKLPLNQVLDLIDQIRSKPLPSSFQPYYGATEDSLWAIHVREISIQVPAKTLKEVPYFDKLMSSGMQEMTSRTITMDDVDPLSLQLLLTYAAKPRRRTLFKATYHDLCMLHSLCDRFSYEKCASACVDLMVTYLSEATCLELICYLHSTSSGYELPRIKQALHDFVLNNDRFQQELIGSLDDSDFQYALNNCNLTAGRKLVLQLNHLIDGESMDYSSIVLPSTLQELGRDASAVMNAIQRTNNVNLLKAALVLMMQKSVETARLPSNFNVIPLHAFDFSKLSLGPVTEHYIGSNYREKIKRATVLYDGRNDWLIELPTVPFLGVKTCPDMNGGNRSQATVSLRHDEQEKNQAFIDFTYRMDEWLIELVLNSPEIKTILRYNSNVKRDYIRAIIKPFLYHVRDHTTGEVIPGRNITLFLNVFQGTILRDVYTDKDLRESDVVMDQVNLVDPYMLSTGLIKMSLIYFFGGKPCLQKQLVYGQVKQPTTKRKPQPSFKLRPDEWKAIKGSVNQDPAMTYHALMNQHQSPDLGVYETMAMPIYTGPEIARVMAPVTIPRALV